MKADGLRVPISIRDYRNFRFTHPVIRRSSTINANRGVPLDSIALPGNFDGLQCFFHCQQCLNVTGSAGYRGFPILMKQLLAEKTNKQKNKQKQLIIFNSFTLVYTHICIRYENQSLIHAIHVLTAFSNFSQLLHNYLRLTIHGSRYKLADELIRDSSQLPSVVLNDQNGLQIRSG